MLNQVYQSLVSDENKSAVIPQGHLVVIEFTNVLNYFYQTLGHLSIVVNDATLGKVVSIFNTDINKFNYIYLPNHNYNYEVVFVPTQWFNGFKNPPTITIYSMPINNSINIDVNMIIASINTLDHKINTIINNMALPNKTFNIRLTNIGQNVLYPVNFNSIPFNSFIINSILFDSTSSAVDPKLTIDILYKGDYVAQTIVNSLNQYFLPSIALTKDYSLRIKSDKTIDAVILALNEANLQGLIVL